MDPITFLSNNSRIQADAPAHSPPTRPDSALGSSDVHFSNEAERADLDANPLNIGDPNQKHINWAKYKGVLKSGPDPVEFQRQLREEWGS